MVRRINLRAALSVAVVLTHLAGVTHMALVAHTLAASGAVVEAEPLATPDHRHEEGSVCAKHDAPDTSWNASESCEAVAWTHVAARPVHPPVAHVDPRRALVKRELSSHQRAHARPPLAFAPKASPPTRA